MRAMVLAAVAAALAMPIGVSASADEGGCLKYGAGGAVAGHFAGHHTASGAAVGCGVGAWKRHKAHEAERAQDRAYQQGLRDQDGTAGYR